MAIAFLPIDIDVRLPNEQVLLEYCNQYSITKDLAPEDEWSTSTWHIGPVMARMDSEEWYDPEKALHALHNRYNPNMGECRYANNIDKIMPQIPYMLEQLPFKELTLVSLFLQTKEVGRHYDPHVGDIYSDPTEIGIDMEPHRYNILLTQHGKPSFYLCDTRESDKVFPTITRERPAFAFCERYHFHGADYIGPGKVLLTVFGILDREKHKQMIAKNLEKYRDEAIIFDDPDDPTNERYHFIEKASYY
jgi:hypothetical protein